MANMSVRQLSSPNIGSGTQIFRALPAERGAAASKDSVEVPGVACAVRRKLCRAACRRGLSCTREITSQEWEGPRLNSYATGRNSEICNFACTPTGLAFMGNSRSFFSSGCA